MPPDPHYPPYTYIPGRNPHPTSDPAGHAYQAPHEAGSVASVASFDTERWRESLAFQAGMELYLRGYYWEAHESWEAVWLALGRTCPEALFVKGLIKLAAAGVKCLEGQRNGAIRHAARAVDLLLQSHQPQLASPWVEVAQQIAAEPPICDMSVTGQHPSPLPGFTPDPRRVVEARPE